MSSVVRIRSTDFMESQNEKESLQTRIREVEDENQELRAQNLLQNRTVSELRNELMMLRIQMNELADTSALLRERVRTLVQNSQHRIHHDDNINAGLVTVPPLMAPPPVPPPLPPPRIRISPRQVGAGEAITTPLGITLSSPPRHRIKRDCRQGINKSSRVPYRRWENSQPGPSSQNPLYSSDRPNYFVGLKIIPQFQTFLCPTGQTCYSDSASDSSGSDENPQLTKKSKLRSTEGESAVGNPREVELVKNVRNLHHQNHQNVQKSILQNYSFSLPSDGKFFFPTPWDRRGKENASQPSTSQNEDRLFHGAIPSTSERMQTTNIKVSDCVQYTFPTIHEGLHNSGNYPLPTSRLRKYKKNIPYVSQHNITVPETSKEEENEEAKFSNDRIPQTGGANLEVGSSRFSIDDARGPPGEIHSDIEQDGFQGDESSNCLTSTDNSLERISMSELEKKKKN